MSKLLSAVILASASVSTFASNGGNCDPFIPGDCDVTQVSEPETMALFAVAAVAVAAVRYFKK